MSRLDIKSPSRAQTVVDNLYRDVERRIAASPPGLCPVDMSLAFLQLCHAQSCGKCVPCRIGLGQLSKLIATVLDGTADMSAIAIIEKTARTIVNTADCAIGRDAARLVLDGLDGFRDDYEEHIIHHRCLAGLQLPVPCVALCPAGVDVPGYMALVGEGRCADAVRLIRKDNPFPTACAYICEHPCEARCRRNMIDDAINIRGLKRYAVDHAGDVPQPACAPPTGKKVAIIGGGPSGLSCAYYLALMGHKVTVFEERAKLGGMLRYGIPSYRLPREVLDAEIASMLSIGIDVHVNVDVGNDVTFDELRPVSAKLRFHEQTITDLETEKQELRGQVEDMQSQVEDTQGQLDNSLAQVRRLAYLGKKDLDPKDYENFLIGYARLSAKELEICCALARGLSTRQCAEQLGCAVSTIDTYRKRIYDKTKIHKVRQLQLCYALMRMQQAEQEI